VKYDNFLSKGIVRDMIRTRAPSWNSWNLFVYLVWSPKDSESVCWLAHVSCQLL